MNKQLIAEYLRKIADLLVADEPKQYELPFDEVAEVAELKPTDEPKEQVKRQCKRRLFKLGFHLLDCGNISFPYQLEKVLGFKPSSCSVTMDRSIVYYQNNSTGNYKLKSRGSSNKNTEIQKNEADGFLRDLNLAKAENDTIYYLMKIENNTFKIC